jgi:hypothetical protein
MAIQKINLGSAGNDGTGDAIRTAFSKANDNFSELYGRTTGLTDIVSDISPQLGGSLDVNSKSIVSTSNGNILISPNGTGYVLLDTVRITDSAITSNTANTDLALTGNGTGKVSISGLKYPSTDGANGQVLQTNGSGILSWVNNAGGGGGSTGDLSIIGSTISGPSNADVNIFQGGLGHIVLDGLKIRDNKISTTSSNSNLELTANASGKVSISGIVYPTTDGSNGQVLQTNGSGVLSFGSIPASQNLFATVSGDSGSTTANTVTDTLSVVGATGVTTAISGDTLTITGPNLSSYLQNLSGQNFTTLSDVATPSASDDGKVLYYDHTSTSFKWKTDSATLSTDAVSEGSSNLYFTNARADARITNALKDEDNMASNSATHIPSQQSVKAYVDSQILTKDNTDEIAEGSSNLYYTNARADARIAAASINALADVNTSGIASGKILKYNGSAWVMADDATSGGGAADAGTLQGQNLAYVLSYANHTGTPTIPANTSQISENAANLYYTNARADARIAAAQLSALSNVHTATPTDGQVLKWDNGNSRWAPAADNGHSNTDSLSEGSSNLYFTNARADARITNALKDEDNMASNSATHVPSQQSVKAYIDSSISGISTTSLNTGAITYDDNEILGTRSNENILITPAGTGAVVISKLETGSISAPSTLSGTYTISSPTTITLSPTSEIINTAPMKLLGKTIAQLRAGFTASNGSMVAVSDDGHKPAYYDGSNWKYVATNGNV